MKMLSLLLAMLLCLHIAVGASATYKWVRPITQSGGGGGNVTGADDVDVFVNETGDTMTGNLNLSADLYVKNILAYNHLDVYQQTRISSNDYLIFCPIPNNCDSGFFFDYDELLGQGDITHFLNGGLKNVGFFMSINGIGFTSLNAPGNITYPVYDNQWDLGNTTNRFRNFYLSRNFHNGTDSVTSTQIINATQSTTNGTFLTTTTADTSYLRLDASNDPVTNDLDIQGEVRINANLSVQNNLSVGTLSIYENSTDIIFHSGGKNVCIGNCG